MYDVAIIGAGVSGSALAYRLSRCHLRVLVLEKENDVALGSTRANTAIIHGGYDPEPGTQIARFNVEGARLCFELCERLQVEYRKTGSLVVAFDEDDRKVLRVLYERGRKNGVPGMAFISGGEVREREPELSEEIIEALWIPESGVMNPWEFALAMMQVAVREGVELKLREKVEAAEDAGGHYLIRTEKHRFEARFIVNAAGVHSDEVHAMAAAETFQLEETKGEYYLLDRASGEWVHSVIFQCPGRMGKGILVSPTIHQNTLVGPNAEVTRDKEDTSVTRAGLDQVALMARRSVPRLDLRSSIRNYAGIRANSRDGDFHIGFAAPRFLDMAAIKSPGLTCAPAFALYAEELLMSEGLQLHEKESWDGSRSVTRFKEIPEERRADWIREHPLYGRVICRCESITEGEIVAAIHMPVPPVSLDGIKRRAGTGMGRCQGGFCGPRILKILARETGLREEEITLDRDGSWILCGEKGGPDASV